ncbi:MAG: hypothetical protein PHE55_05045 [Methylococcaceae bacterium]|nr:hypothetical protein [Methylococcaceae bacterium]
MALIILSHNSSRLAIINSSHQGAQAIPKRYRRAPGRLGFSEHGQVTYFPTALTSVLVKPGLDKVIPLAPEFVQPQDGAEKQDCEFNAAKRWLAEWGDVYRSLKVTVPGRRPVQP